MYTVALTEIDLRIIERLNKRRCRRDDARDAALMRDVMLDKTDAKPVAHVRHFDLAYLGFAIDEAFDADMPRQS